MCRAVEPMLHFARVPDQQSSNPVAKGRNPVSVPGNPIPNAVPRVITAQFGTPEYTAAAAVPS